MAAFLMIECSSGREHQIDPSFNDLESGESMDLIKKVTIKNFRSIVREEFEPSRLTIFVGKNDSGKSNFLRALNLFFNGETDLGQRLNFQTDFSTITKVGRGKAKQIEVWIDIEPPASFSDRSVIRWRRAWREGIPEFAWQGIHKLGDSKELSGRSKVHSWLARIRYKYVPAIKGADYFSALLRDVHDVLAETVDKQLRSASSEFIKTIREHTSQISDLTANALGLESKLQLPADLRALFEVLDFETTSTGGVKSLKQRGDGIKVRHISAILKFISDQERKLTGSGRIRPATIWGYEEPENNLELARAFEHANELYEFSQDIQVLISTHSPAFYSLLAKHEDARGYCVIPTDDGTLLEGIGADGVAGLDEGLGLMTLVAPYIQEKADELIRVKEQAEKLAAEIQSRNKLVILVGGETDADYVRSAVEVLGGDIAKRVVVCFMGKSSVGGAQGGGDSNLLRFAKELASKPELQAGKILTLLDCDVKSVPGDGSDRLRYERIPFDASKIRFKKGIENLLPDELALPRFYDEKIKVDDYGAKSSIVTLKKVMLCKEICDKNSDLPVSWEERFVSFSPIIVWAREMLE